MGKYQVTKEELKQTVAFTGYRTQKLPFDSWDAPMGVTIREYLYREYESLIKMGYRYFLTGGAEGSDLTAAEVILELRRKYKGKYRISHEICLPCYNHNKNWSDENKARFEEVAKKSIITYVNECEYFNGCMQARNRFMVDTSSVLVCVYDGQSGGTKYTVEYAESRKKKIINIRPGEPVMRIENVVTETDLYFFNLRLDDDDESDGTYKVRPRA